MTENIDKPESRIHARVRTCDHLTVPQSLKDPHTYRELAKLQLIYSLFGLVLGLACVLGGMVLCLNGVAGSTSWTAQLVGAESKISDATPGVVLFVVGLFVVWVTRFSVNVQR
jgi:hypothetical protein